MKTASFGSFQVGIVDDPSIEDKGGFDFASGMDIFSEPGVLKACGKMVPVSFGTGAAPAVIPTWMVDTTDATQTVGYIIAGDKILESTNGATWNLFLTNANGANLGLGIYAGRVWYAAASKLGYAPVGAAGSKNDNFATIDTDAEYHPMILQSGTLKLGAGRYITSVDEAFAVTNQALKLVSGYRIKSLAEYLTRLFMGTKFGAMPEAITYSDASVFDWRGKVLSSGSALPETPYPLKMLGMNALLSDGGRLFGFPGNEGDVHLFTGSVFEPFRKLSRQRIESALVVNPGAVGQYEGTMLFAGQMTKNPGVFQMKDGAICGAFVPSAIIPGASDVLQIGFVKTSFFKQVLIGYWRVNAGTFHIEKSSTDLQNSAFVRTLWHRFKTDRLKRHIGVKLNLKPMAANTSVAVAYRTTRAGSFTDSGYTITSANQDKPVILAAQPRSREIQYRFTYTTDNANGPELLSYDPLYEVLTTNR
jgi:hypothetical protein